MMVKVQLYFNGPFRRIYVSCIIKLEYENLIQIQLCIMYIVQQQKATDRANFVYKFKCE